MMRRPLCLLCLAFAAALSIFLALSRPPSSLPEEDGRLITVSGQVCGKEYRSGYGGDILLVYLKSVRVLDKSEANPQKQIKGAVCYMAGGEEPLVGSAVEVRGEAEYFPPASNPGQFDERQYYEIQNIRIKLKNAALLAQQPPWLGIGEGLCRVRRFFAALLDRYFDEKDASVMKAMLLGEKSGVDREVKKLYKQNGISHILAISGLHISLIGMGLYRLFRRCRLPLPLSALLAAGMTAVYGAMTGMAPTAFRAVLMFGLHMLADMTGRSYDMLTAAGVAAVLLLLEQPLYLTHSGFLFSFGAVAALGVVLPAMEGRRRRLRRGEERERLLRAGRKLKNGWISGLSVFIFTLPVHLYFYYGFPVYSLILNLLVIPLLPLLMCSGFLCLLFGPFPFLSPAAGAAAAAGHAALTLYEKGCLCCGELPFGQLITGKPAAWQILCYAVLVVLFLVFHRKFEPFVRWLWLLTAVLLLTAPHLTGLRVTFLDVGQGDGSCVRTEDGRGYVVDGGSSSVSGVGTYRILPCLKEQGISRVEAVFVTHSDADHVNGLMELMEEGEEEGVRIGCLILPDIGEKSRDEAYAGLVGLAQRSDIPVRYMSRGESVRDGELAFTCLHPEKGYETGEANEYSMTLYLTYGGFSALLTGDLEGKGEEETVRYMKAGLETAKESLPTGSWRSGPPLTLLKAGHHGSRNSTGEELLSLLRPSLTVISCGRDNRYGHPHRELLARLEEVNSRICLTMEEGAVTVWTDGKRVEKTGFLEYNSQNGGKYAAYQ